VDGSDKNPTNCILPSASCHTKRDIFRSLPTNDHARRIYETLTKQYELAKVQEAKEIPPIKVLDEPQVPERKSSPHRSVIVLLWVLVSAFAGIVWIVACKLWEIIYGSHSVKAIIEALDRTTRGHDAVAPN